MHTTNAYFLSQFTEEKLGQAEKTELDAHLENLLVRAENTKQWTERIMKQTEVLLQPNPSETTLFFFFFFHCLLNLTGLTDSFFVFPSGKHRTVLALSIQTQTPFIHQINATHFTTSKLIDFFT